MQVAQIDSNKWAVTARGANARYANKLLVLMDGRTLYNPLLSGVYWDAQDTNLGAIDRIEVIRGPGSTMWGANAVNGVVNIITKSSSDTLGGDLSVLASDRDSFEGVIRYGEQSDQLAYRVYAKYLERGGNVDLAGANTGDFWDMARIGGRADWFGHDGQEMTLSAEIYSGETGDANIIRTLTPPYETTGTAADDVSGGFVLFGWSADLDGGSHLQIRSYLSREKRIEARLQEHRDTFDFDLQQNLSLGVRHELMWGLGLRQSRDETIGGFEIQLNPSKSTQSVISTFVQDDIEVSENLRLIVGSKFENSNHSDRDIEVAPSVRFSLRLNDAHAIWASASRAIRVPSREELDGMLINSILPPGQPALPLPVPIAVSISANDQLKSEVVSALEFGYRYRADSVLFDLALFYNDYNNLRGLRQSAPLCQPSGDVLVSNPACILTATHVEAPLILENQSFSETVGAEVWVSKQVADSWNVQLSYTYYHNLRTDTANPFGQVFPEDSPEHQLSIKSTMDLSDKLALDLWLRYVDELEVQQIEEYSALDVRLAWSPLPTVDISAVGRNLIAGRHAEFVSELGLLVPIQIEPEGYIELRWGF